jgi:hypothetical protein
MRERRLAREGQIIADGASDEAFESYWRRPDADARALRGAGGRAPASEGDPPIRAPFVEARCVRVSQRIVSRSAPRSLFKSSVPLPRLVGPRSSARPMPPPDR